MTVEELIEELKNFSKTALVIVDAEGIEYTPVRIEYINGEVVIDVDDAPEIEDK